MIRSKVMGILRRDLEPQKCIQDLNKIRKKVGTRNILKVKVWLNCLIELHSERNLFWFFFKNYLTSEKQILITDFSIDKRISQCKSRPLSPNEGENKIKLKKKKVFRNNKQKHRQEAILTSGFANMMNSRWQITTW